MTQEEFKRSVDDDVRGLIRRGEEKAIAHQPSVIEVIQALAVDERVNVEKLAALMGLQERAEAREAERQFNIDFAGAMSEMPTIRKDKAKDMGGKGSIPYASYEQLDRIIRPIEQKYGFCRTFSTAPLEKSGSLMTVTLVHRGGHSRSSTRYQSPDGGPGRNDAQAQGSADSYNKRYLTIGIWNIVTVGADDDGMRAGAISQDQVDDINSLISEIGMSAAGRAAFFQLADVRTVEEIPQRRYKDIMQALASKRRAQAK
jgi:hypothetical protein